MDKYMQLFKLLNNGRFDLDDINNNNSIGQVGRRDRKRRHSTCQNFLEKKKLTPGNSFFLETTESFPVHIVPGKSGKLLNMENINLDKIIMFNDDSIINEIKCDKDTEQNYYKNILQQQHALIKQMDSTRPLTR